MKKIFYLLLFTLCLASTVMAQDTKPDQQEEAPIKKKPKAVKTFQSSQVINLPSVEMLKKNNLQFMVSHHFGILWNKDANAGQNFAQVLGLNSGIAHTYLSFDYSITDYANVGIALAGSSKFEGWAKFKILKQQKGKSPVSLGWISVTRADALANPQDTSKANKLAWNKYSFMHGLLIARRLTSKISVQLMPAMIHYNIVPYGIRNRNNIYSLSIAGKYQLKPTKAITFEYSRQLNVYRHVLDKNGNITTYSPDLISLGMEFNTGGHVFQFFVGNTTSGSIIEQLSRNTNRIGDGQFALGFRLNRGFFLGPKE
jgi:hypothetical protein